jgi:uncharacterized phosphosugar-binding protein
MGQPEQPSGTWLRYASGVCSLIETFTATQGPAIERAAGLVGESLADEGVLHIFGTGHSQMAAQEIYLRAGGLAAVNAILDGNLSFYGITNSDRLERLEGYAEILLGEQDLRPGEVVIVVSNSGLNAVPIEAARLAQERGCRVVAVTSQRSYASLPSRHSSGARLADFADAVIDTGTPAGDALVAIPGLTGAAGPVSTILSALALQCVVTEVIAQASAEGRALPVFQSSNVPGGDDHNAQTAAALRLRLPNIRV